MLQNLLVVALLITIAWMGLIGYYLYLSHQQRELRQQLETLEALLASKERPTDG